jgi:spore maturation protein CgeB
MNQPNLSKPQNQRLLLVGYPGAVHIGAHLANAAAALKIPARLLDLTAAWSSNRWVNRFHRHLNGHRPVHLRRFSRLVLDTCRSYRPTVLLATGIAPLDSSVLQAIRRLDIPTCNYLTDDPFNPVHRAPWFLRALPHYGCVFSPRRANIADLQAAGCGDVTYMPFAYAPEIHFPEPPASPVESPHLSPDVFFAGEADDDRVPYMSTLIWAGFKVALYGGCWDRYRETRPAALGHADPATVRRVAASAKVSICLVRRANRDGHSMRSFELPAMGACLAVEDTAEHRDLFGSHFETVLFFRTPEELTVIVKYLKEDAPERIRLAAACHARICRGHNTYRDRLTAMLSHVQAIGGQSFRAGAGAARFEA